MPDDAPAPFTPRRAPRSANNTRQLERVSRNRQIVQNVLAKPEALALAEARGQGEPELSPGIALATSFLKTYGARDAATGTQENTRAGLRASADDARKAYTDLRTTLRTLYHGKPADLVTLGVSNADAATDRDAFLDEARVTVAAVREAPYAAAAAKVGYPAKALDAVEAAVAALETAAGGTQDAVGMHGGSTAARNAAYRAFMDWMADTRRWLTLAFKGHPEIARSVGLTTRTGAPTD